MSAAARTYDALIFDFDGTLVDSDEELVRAFVVRIAARQTEEGEVVLRQVDAHRARLRR